jgi:thiamine biosynthesis protein ThiS
MQVNQTKSIKIVVNGDAHAVPENTTVLALLELLHIDPERVAVELNRAIIRRPAWSGTTLTEGAQLEIVQFVGGG